MEQATNTKRYIIACLLSLLTIATQAATIHGHITDRLTGKALSGVFVKIDHSRFKAVTDAAGNYVIHSLPAAAYTLTCNASGYSAAGTQVVINADTDDVVCDIQLSTVINVLPGITILGLQAPASDLQAHSLEKNADKVVNILSLETIERATGITVADVARQVAGVSAMGNDGEGGEQKILIRGMDPKYNYTLVNGVSLPSPDDRARTIPLNIFPAGLVQRLEVYKSLTPDMEANAIGGVVNVVMKEAGETPALKLTVETGYNQHYFNADYTGFNSHVIQKRSPYEIHGPAYTATGADFTKDNLSFNSHHALPDLMGNVTYSRQLLHHKLGLLVTADYQQVRNNSNGFFVAANNEPLLNNVPGLSDFYTRNYDRTTTRAGIFNTLSYNINERNTLRMFQFFADQQEQETRFSTDTSLVYGRTKPGTGRINAFQRSRTHQQRMYSNTLEGVHHLGNQWLLSWKAVYSTARGLYPDWAELTQSTSRIEQPNGAVIQGPLLLSPLDRTWLRNTETNIDGHAGLQYKPTEHLTLKAGAMLRHKTRENFYNSYTFQPLNGEVYTDIYHAQWGNDNGPQNPLGAINNPNTYTGHERITAYYAMANYAAGKWEATGGLRMERTHQDFVSSVDPATSFGKDVTISYHDLLPSLSLKYAFSDKQHARFTYFKGISRPALEDVTFFSLDYEDYRVAGNPFLIRTRADNLDLRYEWYPNYKDVLQAGIFYKRLTDPYEKTLLNANDTLYPIASQGMSYTPAGLLTEQLRNAGIANTYGLEVAFSKSVGAFSIMGNYTFSASTIHVVTKYKTREHPEDPGSDVITVSKSETRALEGQSRHLGNLSLVYKTNRSGFTGQLSAVYTGKRIYAASGWYGLEYWQRAQTWLDASLEKRIGHRYSVFVKAANLLHTGTVIDILQTNPEAADHYLPGKQQSDKITTSNMSNSSTYRIGVRMSL